MSDTEESMSTEEIAKVVSALKQLKMKPKADSAEDFFIMDVICCSGEEDQGRGCKY